MKKVMVLLFLIVSFLAFPNLPNGYDWIEMEDDQKLSYVKGALGENVLLLSIAFERGIISKEDLDFFIIKGEDFEEMVENIDHFYKVTSDLSHPILFAIHGFYYKDNEGIMGVISYG